MTLPILTLDLGTSGAKGALVSVDGTVSATSFHAYPTTSLPGGGSEQDPQAWIDQTRETILDLLPASGVAAIVLTGQMQDLICIDARGQAIGFAVLYNDTRATEQAAALHETLPEWNAITGNEQSATSLPALWARAIGEDATLAAKTHHLLFSPASYVVAQLGLGYFCDETTASTTGLLDLSSRTWSQRICEAAKISVAALPTISSGMVGFAPANNHLGIPADTPIVLAPGDAACATAGLVGLKAGEDYVSFGTSGWHAQVVKEQQDPGATHQLALPGHGFLRIAAILSVGGTADWARQRFLPGVTTSASDAMLMRAVRQPTGIISLPSLRGERFPVRNDRLGAALIDIPADADNLRLYAAVLEGVCFGFAHDISGTGPLPATGGGSRSLPWMRMLADVTGRTIRVTPSNDAALRGAAIFAAEVLDLGTIEPLSSHAIVDIEPDPQAHAAYQPLRVRQRMLYDALSQLPR